MGLSNRLLFVNFLKGLHALLNGQLEAQYLIPIAILYLVAQIRKYTVSSNKTRQNDEHIADIIDVIILRALDSLLNYMDG